jgi:hypothetical protein
VVEPRRVADGWYFEFEYRCRRDLPKEQWEGFGGAPAFIVGSDETVRVVGWDELAGPLEGGAAAWRNGTVQGGGQMRGDSARRGTADFCRAVAFKGIVHMAGINLFWFATEYSVKPHTAAGRRPAD